MFKIKNKYYQRVGKMLISKKEEYCIKINTKLLK